MFVIRSKPPQTLSDPTKWSPEFVNFVSRCLIVDPSKRPSAQDLLHDPFLQLTKRYSQNSLRELVTQSMPYINQHRDNNNKKNKLIPLSNKNI